MRRRDCDPGTTLPSTILPQHLRELPDLKRHEPSPTKHCSPSYLQAWSFDPSAGASTPLISSLDANTTALKVPKIGSGIGGYTA